MPLWDGKPTPDKSCWRFKQTLDLNDLKSTIAANRGKELTIFPSHSIFLAILTPEIESWNVFASNLFDKYEKEIRSFVARLIRTVASGKMAAYFSHITDSVMATLSDKVL